MIGLGVISKYYLAALEELSDFELVAVCDLDDKKTEPFREQGVKAYTDYRDLLSEALLDAVVINVPNDQHFQICKEAMLAGKHVCCEKPLTIHLHEAEELVSVSRQTNQTLFTAFHRRYNVHVVDGWKKIGSLKDIKEIRARYFEDIREHAGSDTWYLNPDKCGGGCIADNGPNLFDTLSFFLGPLTVVESKVKRDRHGVDKVAQIRLETGKGLLVTAELDWDYPHGERKDITLFTQDGTEIHMDMLRNFQVFKSSLYHEYEAALKDFQTAVEAGNSHGESGCDAVRLVTEAYHLEREGAFVE